MASRSVGRPMKPRLSLLAATAAVFVAVSATPALANHSWRGYHWARKRDPFSVRIVDSVISGWDTRLRAVNSAWNVSSHMNNVIEPGTASSQARRRCAPISGKLRACNAAYGFTGWLGIATIRVVDGHITAGTAKHNDSYFALAQFNTSAARRHVMCQEIGHLFGLDHQYTQPTCMDDRSGINDPAYTTPASHDYAQLDAIYGSHLDRTVTIASSGKVVSTERTPDGTLSTYRFVTWVRHFDPNE